MNSLSSSNSPVSVDFEHFDWSILDTNTEPPDQPYFLKPYMKISEFQPKMIRADNSYSKAKNGVRYSTAEGKEELERFKKKLRLLQSSYGTFYTSCVDYSIVEKEYKINSNKFMHRKTTTLKSEIERKGRQEGSLHKYIPYNEQKRSREGLACACNKEEFKKGVHHYCFAGEGPIPKCDPHSNNLDKLQHYFLKVTQSSKKSYPISSLIVYDEKYEFEGISIFLHQPYPKRFPASGLNDIYEDWTYELVEEEPPTHFTVNELEVFHDYLYGILMETMDLQRFPASTSRENSCPTYHIYPRFVQVDGDQKRILSMSIVLSALRRNLVAVEKLFKNGDAIQGKLFVHPEKRPKALRVDEYEINEEDNSKYPIFYHKTVLSSTVINFNDPILKGLINKNGRGKMARSIKIPFSAAGFYHTGLYPDITIHALMCLAAIAQIRFRFSLCYFEETVLGFALKNPILLELAFMHPSYKASFGTNPSHCRTTIANCGFLDFSATSKKVARRRGFETLMDAMNLLLSDFSKESRKSFLFDNERLEFLGDAVIGFVVTVRLFYLFPHSNEGFFASCRSCLVRNETFAYFADWLGLEDYLLICHVSDSSNQMDINHALANSFEALMGAIYLDAGITVVDRVFSDIISKADMKNFEFKELWSNPPHYILKNDFPFGDRHIIEHYSYLQELAAFEESIGIYFHHIRILARAFTKRGKGDNFLTEGDNQTLEFLGDSVLQLMATNQLYRMFPYHNEGNLSILRSCLVSNNTQSLICDDLGLEKYLLNPDNEISESVGDIRKDKADLLEALIGAIFIDSGFDVCQSFCDVCYFPRLKNFIISQSWNDPKSLLQQCCLMLRNEVKETPHVPRYRVVQKMGPTNAREYVTAVFINDKRLATGFGTSVREAEMDAAAQALLTHSDLFPASFMAMSLFALCNENKNGQNNDMKIEAKSDDGV